MAERSFAPSTLLPETPHEIPNGGGQVSYRPAGYVLQILTRPFASEVAARIAMLADEAAHGVRSAGPGIWYVVGDAALTHAEIEQRKIRLGPEATLIDQTHGRVRIELVGPGAVALLATGTAIDASPKRFPEGSSCETMFGHIGVHVTKTGPERFELLVGRSFAMSLWEELTS